MGTFPRYGFAAMTGLAVSLAFGFAAAATLSGPVSWGSPDHPTERDGR